MCEGTDTLFFTTNEAVIPAIIAFTFSNCEARVVGWPGDTVQISEGDEPYTTIIPPGKAAIAITSDLSLNSDEIKAIAQAGLDTARRISPIS